MAESSLPRPVAPALEWAQRFSDCWRNVFGSPLDPMDATDWAYELYDGHAHRPPEDVAREQWSLLHEPMGVLATRSDH